MDVIVPKIDAFMRRQGLVFDEQSLLVACSGGADSVALLVALARMYPGVRIGCAHFEHGLRGDASLADMAFVRETAGRLGIPFHTASAEAGTIVGRAVNLEAEARRQRYRFLESTAELEGYDWIALGHTADDQVETVVYKIFRGASLSALAGMPAVRGRIIRPLIGCRRREIEAWLTGLGYAWHEDASNRDCRFRRNALRQNILPLIEQSFPDLRTRILALAGDAASENRDLPRLLKAFGIETREEPGPAVSWDWGRLVAAPHSLVLRLVAARFSTQADSGSLPRKGWYRALEGWLEADRRRGGTLYHGAAGILALHKGRLFCHPPRATAYESRVSGMHPVVNGGVLGFPWGEIRSDLVSVPAGMGRNFFQAQAAQGIFWIDASVLLQSPVLRAVHATDRLHVSAGSRQFVADLLSGAGVPGPWRASTLVLAGETGCDAVFVPALPHLGRIGATVMLGAESRQALRLEVVQRRIGKTGEP
ncbi:MAG TPA: tRNA lysidine(34) synthetase TilS [Spirochaetota bacterium]|nr:tRNA lysidine(34) synthetase TilS [Spirochaetota bacterium]